jgi:hypothetical protein
MAIDTCLVRHPTAAASATPITAACLLVHAKRLSVLTTFDVLRLCTQERFELCKHSHQRRAHLLSKRVKAMCRHRQAADFKPCGTGACSVC